MSEISTLPEGIDLIAVPTIGSTNDELKSRAVKENAAEGTAIWSLEQTSGKGRQQRDWVSKPGNMYVSLLLRPDCAMAEAAQIGFLPVIAAGEALSGFLGNAAPLRYKWPNDLLLNRKKIGGALLEAGVGQNGMASWVVVGCGVNLQHYPDDTRFPATSVSDEMSETLELEPVVHAYLHNLLKWYHIWQEEGFAPVRAAWLESAHTFDEPLVVETGGQILTGPFRDLDHHGALIIETESGEQTISAGDVYFSGGEGSA